MRAARCGLVESGEGIGVDLGIHDRDAGRAGHAQSRRRGGHVLEQHPARARCTDGSRRPEVSTSFAAARRRRWRASSLSSIQPSIRRGLERRGSLVDILESRVDVDRDRGCRDTADSAGEAADDHRDAGVDDGHPARGEGRLGPGKHLREPRLAAENDSFSPSEVVSMRTGCFLEEPATPNEHPEGLCRTVMSHRGRGPGTGPQRSSSVWAVYTSSSSISRSRPRARPVRLPRPRARPSGPPRACRLPGAARTIPPAEIVQRGVPERRRADDHGEPGVDGRDRRRHVAGRKPVADRAALLADHERERLSRREDACIRSGLARGQRRGAAVRVVHNGPGPRPPRAASPPGTGPIVASRQGSRLQPRRPAIARPYRVAIGRQGGEGVRNSAWTAAGGDLSGAEDPGDALSPRPSATSRRGARSAEAQLGMRGPNAHLPRRHNRHPR